MKKKSIRYKKKRIESKKFKKTKGFFDRLLNIRKKNKDRVLVGKYIATKSEFGFVALDGTDEEYFISGKDRNTAFDGDIVEIEPYSYSSGKRKEARITDIIERTKKTLVGVFRRSDSFGFVLPDSVLMNEDVYIPKSNFNGAKDNDKVVIEIVHYGGRGKKPEGKVIEVLGKIGDKGIDVLSIIREFEVPVEFPSKVVNQADNVAKPVSEKDIDFRKDFRSLYTVTIDGEDTKDFDDAVSIEQIEDKIHLGVHIADVSNYVQEGSALDKEALKRGTSIYPVDRVVPMLPESLSNGICSLNESEDRLTLSCMMVFDKDGELLEYDITESVINVKKRLTYTQVYQNLSGLSNELKAILPMLKLMKRLANKLKKKREKRGAVDFDFKESKIVLDEENKAVDILLRERNIATSIIEEFMLAANETVAGYFAKRDLPFVYRVHEKPDKDKVTVLVNLCKKLGYSIRIGKEGISSKQIQNLLKKVKDTDLDIIISRTALRSMQQAGYSVECNGHFGLASKYYCHFTSPIRRYPDLQIHRIIRENLHNRLTPQRIEHYHTILDEVARRSSAMERKAVDIERKSEKIKKAEYMQDYLGEVFEGHISGLTSRGLFVELDNTVEGMVSIDSMRDDYYEYDEASMSLIGERGGCMYTLGNPVQVQVVRADKQTGNIDFVLFG